MKKLYLLLDEWDNDRNFVGYELEEIMKHYVVTLICNSATEPARVNGDFVVYRKPGAVRAVCSMLKGLLNRDVIQEIKNSVRGKTNRSKIISEILSFYVNADLFRSFMLKKGYLEDDVIYYSYWYFWKCYAVTSVIDRYPASRVITRAHGYDLYDNVRPSGYQPFKEAMDSRLGRIVFISEFGMDYYKNRFGVNDSGKYVLSCLGTIDHDRMNPGSGTAVISLVSCSHINTVKRVHLIVRALSLIDDLSIKWIHFGDGDKADEVRELACQLLDGKANIEYEFTGQVDNRRIHDYYCQNQVDAFVSASQSEGNPVSVMEAMSYGIPVIAPSICNFPNMIGEGGLLTGEDCNPDELAAAIKKLGSMPDSDRLAMRCASRRIWEEKFNVEQNSRKFVENILGSL